MMDEEIDAAAVSDPDWPPLSAEEGARARVVRPEDRRRL
jgi:hypothetical protein